MIVAWEHDEPGDVFRWVVYYELDDSWEYEICARKDRSVVLPLFAPVEVDSLDVAPQPDVPGQLRPRVSVIAVSAVDRTGNESARTRVMLGR